MTTPSPPTVPWSDFVLRDFRMIDVDLAQALQLKRETSGPALANAILRAGGVRPPDTDPSEPTVRWLERLATGLASMPTGPFSFAAHAKRVSDEAMNILHSDAAPGVARVLMPDVLVPGAEARTVGHRCRQVVGKGIQPICVRILRTMQDNLNGYSDWEHRVVNTDDDMDD